MTTLAPLVILSIPKAPLSYLTLVTSSDKLVSITFGQAYVSGCLAKPIVFKSLIQNFISRNEAASRLCSLKFSLIT